MRKPFRAGPDGPGRFRVVTYNIHKCRGLDRRIRPGRIAEVLREVSADIVALQEVLSVDGGEPDGHQARFLAAALGLDCRMGENRTLEGGVYGNATLSRFPFLHFQNYDITRAGREERGCLRTDIEIASGMILYFYNLHLGTSFRERQFQARRLLDSDILLPSERGGSQIVLGDFNAWIPWLTSRHFRKPFNHVPVRSLFGRSFSYPGVFPLVHLDHIYFDGPLRVVKVAVHQSRKALIASDHLPIFVDFEWKTEPQEV
jgi:endonuclease/exonuclease/phosphatase family metal-dependent hydrolase